MKFKSILKPEGSVIAGVATIVLVAFIHERNLPAASVMHATKAHDVNIEAGRKKAVWESFAAVSALTLLTRDVNIFILGGAAAVVFDFTTRHANVTSPSTGQVVSDQGYQRQLSVVQGAG